MSCPLLPLLKTQLLRLPFCVLLALLAAQTAHSQEPFEFRQNDVVAIYGNGLADRMQHDPWVETVLQSHLKGMNVSFRNLSFSGDLVNQRPRNQGFTNDAEYLQHVAPDVVFIMYGYNESYAGRAGADAYQGELVKLVERYTALQKKKGKDLRVVLFSPIAYQNTGDRNLPEGTELNANLSAYTEATQKAAAQTGATFVDLFTPTKRLFKSNPPTQLRTRIENRKLEGVGLFGSLLFLYSWSCPSFPVPPQFL